MNTKQKVIVGFLSILLLSAVAYLLISMNNSDEANNTNTQGSTNQNSAETIDEADQKRFNPLPTVGESFIVDLVVEDTENDSSYNGTVSYDGDGNYLLEGVFKEDKLRFYSLEDRFISCQNDTCFSLSTGENGVDASTYAYDEEALNDFENEADYVGRSDCPAGTCDTWSITQDDGTNITLYVADDGRISKSEGVVNGSSFSASFTYQPVNIEAPTNVQPSPFE